MEQVEPRNPKHGLMTAKVAIEMIKEKFVETDRPVRILLQRGRSFKAMKTDEGIMVDNLGAQPLLEWVVFKETVELLGRKGGRAEKGNAMACKLGDKGLPLDSIEGHIAYVVYGKKLGDSVFRRISPVSAILVWAGICESNPGELILR